MMGSGPANRCPACLIELALGRPSDAHLPGTQNGEPGTQNLNSRYFADYEIIEEIARGGMGVVYRARQLRLNRPVALKMIAAGQLATPGTVQRFHTEAEAAARLDHPHIVPIYEIGEHEGQHYFSMKLIEGGTLADLGLKSNLQDPTSPEVAARLVGTVARAVHYAHQRGILHRDLKPTNILLNAHGEPNVTDFGLAKLVEDDSSLTLSAVTLGTPAYMAPEQAAGGAKQLTTAADVYSLGAILYELLTGQVPFRAETAVETLRQVCEKEPPPPRSLNPKLNRDLETICLKCLSKDPQQRYGSAELLALDLERWRKGEPILARPASAAEKAWRWCRRRPVVAGLLVALNIVFAVGLAGILWEWHAATEKLIESYTAQARATRGSDRMGRRFDSLATISNAVSLNPTARQREALRSEAIGCFALTDLRIVKQWPLVRPWNEDGEGVEGTWHFDSRLQLYARTTERGEISVRQAADDRETARLPSVGPAPILIDLFSPDSRFLACFYDDLTNRMWDIARGKIVATNPLASSWAFTPEGRSLAVSHLDGSLSIVEVDTWKERRRLSLHPYWMLCYFPDGTRIAGVRQQDYHVEIADLDAGKILDTFEVPENVVSLELSTDGHSMAAGGDNGHIYVWNVATGDRLDIDGHRGEVWRLAFNHEGTLLASASSARFNSCDGTFRLWDPSTGRLVLSAPGDRFHIQFSGDDRYLAYGDYRHVSLAEVTPHPALRLLGRAGRQLTHWPSPGFSPDGRLLTLDRESPAPTLWDLAAGKELAMLENGHAWFNPDGKSIFISGAGELSQWPMETVDATTNVIRLGPGVPLIGENRSVDITQNGRFMAAPNSDGTTVLVYDLAKPAERITLGAHSNLNSIAISPDGRFVATAGRHGSGVKLWDVSSRRTLAELPASVPSSVTFSPDGHWLAAAAGDGSSVQVLDVARGEVIRELPASRPELWPDWVGFSPDGRWLAVGGGNSQVYRLYRAGSWENCFQLTSSKDHLELGCAAFSPDGEIWAVANSPYNTHLYSTVTGRRLAILEAPHQAAITGLGFSPDGATLAAMQTDSVAQIWDLRRIRQELAALKLDWNLPSYPPAPRRDETKPTRVEFIEAPAAEERRAFLSRIIPARPAEASWRQIDLSAHYNAALTESWHEPGTGNDLSELAPGLRELAGVQFDVRGLIQSGSVPPDKLGYPGDTRGIRVNRLCTRLHFLHSAIFAGDTPAGTRIGGYFLFYTDGRFSYHDIVVGTDLLDWWPQPKEDLSRLTVAWTGENQKSRKAGRKVRLFKTTWNNPFPSLPVTRIDFTTAFQKDKARAFLVAITAE
jgi:serine/threonine protein kinase/WD40 repeat protein